MELHHLPVFELLANRQYAGLWVHTDDVAHEKIAVTVFLLTLLHNHSEVERTAEKLLIIGRERIIKLGKHLGSTPTLQLTQNIVFGPRDKKWGTDWSAPLRNDRIHHNIAAQHQGNSTHGVNLLPCK